MKKVFEDNQSQVLEHSGLRVVLEVHNLTGGWYARGQITPMVGYDESPIGIEIKWSISRPKAWGLTKAEALKARTQIKKEIAARIDAEDFEGDFFKYA